MAPSVASDKPAAKSGPRRPLIVGLIMIAVATGGYLGWQHFAHSPGAAVPEPPPPVPVIATTVSISAEMGPQICMQKGPRVEAGNGSARPAELVGVAQPGRARWREAGFEHQARFLKRQLSFPVSTMSQ
jgi:hypothetical protein